jgi:hypothetical protein
VNVIRYGMSGAEPVLREGEKDLTGTRPDKNRP